RPGELLTSLQHLIAKTVSDIEKHQIFRRELVRSNLLSPCPAVAAGYDDAKRLFVKRCRRDAGRLEWKRYDRCIDLAGSEHRIEVAGKVLFHIERHCRRKATQCRDELGQKIRRDGMDDAEAQRPDQRIARRSRDTLDPLSFVEHASRLRDHPLTGRGKQDIALPALEELRIELVLEVLYRRAQARLAYEAAFG